MSSLTVPSSPSGFNWQRRVALLAIVVCSAAICLVGRNTIAPELRALMGVGTFILLCVVVSTNPRAIPWRTVIVGLGLQTLLAFLVLRVPIVFQAFEQIGSVVGKILDYSRQGAEFVFGPLAQRDKMEKAHGTGFVFATMALPPIIFVSSFFAVLYHLGILQLIVRGMSWVMERTMRVTGPEALSASANVFMGQTEAPLIVKPYVKHMSRSQLLALMIGGMATVSGGMLVVFIAMTAPTEEQQRTAAVWFLTTSIMAAPAGLYLSKILYPEDDPNADERMKQKTTEREADAPVNVIDAAARGASDGLYLALNVAAMLIAFIAFVHLLDGILGLMNTSFRTIMASLFAPGAALMGVEGQDVPTVGKLLGIKLVGNELLAFQEVTQNHLPGTDFGISTRSMMLVTFALTGFANFASIGIQLGGIGAMATNQRSNLASLGLRALMGGFLATMINACIAAILL